MAFLFGRATGKSERNLNKINARDQQDHQSQFLAVAAASDIILRCTHRYAGQFQLMIGNQLDMQSVSRLFRDILSAFRLAPSRTYSGQKTVLRCLVEVKRSGI